MASAVRAPVAKSDSPAGRLAEVDGSRLDETRQLMLVLRPTLATMLAAGYANLQARQLLITQTAQPMGEAAVMAATKGLATAFSAGSLIEFFVAPSYGRLSDRYGRKPLLLLFLVTPVLFRSMCVLVKHPAMRIRMLLLDFVSARVAGVQPTIGMFGTMISDVVPVATQPSARSQLTASIAFGQIVGNYASGWWNARFGPESTFKLTAAAPLFVLAFVATCMPETNKRLREAGAPAAESQVPAASGASALPADGARAPAAQTASAPLAHSATKKESAMRTLCRDPESCILATTLGLYEFMQYPGLSTVSILFMADRLGWGPLQAGQFSSAVGLAIFLGSSITSRIMDALGPARFVSFAHASTSLAYLTWGTAKSGWGLGACLFPLALGTGASPVLMTRFMARAASLGAGLGEAAAVVQALGAIARAVAPQVFIRLYLRAKEAKGRGRLGLGSPMLLLSALALVQEALYQWLLRRNPPRKGLGDGAAVSVRGTGTEQSAIVGDWSED